MGQKLANDFSYHTIEGQGTDSWLPVHVEGIYATNGITKMFALGCIKPSEQGGYTRIFDARKGADIIKRKYPNIKDTLIKYSTLSYPNEEATYPLVYKDKQYGDVLRFISFVPTNEICKEIKGYSEGEFYKVVESVVRESILHHHSWDRGDLVFVNNRFTLHDRQPYTGGRKMIRIRFDDKANVTFAY